jgi:hypothetical protein
MNPRRFCALLAVAVLASATASSAAVHKVSPGQSIQAAIDAAAPGDTILVDPGVYQETGNTEFGLHITTDNLRLIGKVDELAGEAGKIRLVHTGTQGTGVYAAPAGCGPGVGVGGCPTQLQGFYIRGFSVEDFPDNGIQTRFVDDFKIIRNESVRNLENGIYPTISANGLVQGNVSYGSLDTAMWVAASQNVRVIENEMYDSVIGLEITVADDVLVKLNNIHDNVVGVGLFHPNAAGNAQLDEMNNWVIEQNHIYNNNLFPNPAPPSSFQAGVPPGVGVLLLGVSENSVSKNLVENNGFVGIGVLGWCTAVSTGPPSRNCMNFPPQANPQANDNRIAQNTLIDNGNGFFVQFFPPALQALAADLTYFDFEGSSGNCFEKNGPAGFTFVSSEPDGLLPTDGC